jgi:hypothetical protein
MVWKKVQKESSEKPGTWIFRDIPRDLMRRTKAAAAIQGKPIRGLVIELVQGHLDELERKNILPKGKR